MILNRTDSNDITEFLVEKNKKIIKLIIIIIK